MVSKEKNLKNEGGLQAKKTGRVKQKGYSHVAREEPKKRGAKTVTDQGGGTLNSNKRYRRLTTKKKRNSKNLAIKGPIGANREIS